MGFGGISIWQLLIILVIVLLLFGTKRLRSIGTDLGSAFKGFKKAVSDGENEPQGKTQHEQVEQPEEQKGDVIEGESTKEQDKK